jgi:DNA-binding NarL/FixJ family response regulator
MAFGDIPNGTGPARLLIVEDDILLASSLDELLSASGFDVVGIAGSAATALGLAEERHPQLALIDIRLVGPIDGIELAYLFREEFRIPAIFLSGLADPETKERALLAQPIAFLRKPYRASQLYNTIARALSPGASFDRTRGFAGPSPETPRRRQRARRDPRQ